ncbi:MAG: T9SS type A sorting domain-containing protein [Bacteroidales bacterium]|nr:T9SS type A sorting domain-containing protein [Bacteroidales bacterium]MCF8458082.1 T9SS type A sorting domain-containing protein [Bacteroidales bacterium]
MKQLAIILLLLTSSTTLFSQWQHLDPEPQSREICGDKNGLVYVGYGSGSVGKGINVYDGLNTTWYDSTNSNLPSNAIRKMVCDTNGNLWVTFFGGFVNSVINLTKFDGTNWTVFNTSNSNIPSNRVWHIDLYEPKNEIWALSDSGIIKYHNGNFTLFKIEGYSPLYATWLKVQDSASIWFNYSYNIARLNPYNMQVDTFPLSFPANYIDGFVLDSYRSLYYGISYGHNCDIYKYTKWGFDLVYSYSGSWMGAFNIDSNNNIWFALSLDGLHYLHNGVDTKVTGVPDDGIGSSIFFDLEGYCWYADRYKGLWKSDYPATAIIGIDEITVSEFNCFPNPCSKQLNVTSGDRGSLVEIFDISGKHVLSKNFNYRTEIDMYEYIDGLYIIRLNNSTKLISKIDASVY